MSRPQTALLLLALTLADVAPVAAQDSLAVLRRQARDADIQGDWQKLAAARARLVALAGPTPEGRWARYHAAYADWRLSSLAWMGGGPRAQLPLLERARAQLDSLVADQPDNADAQALLATALATIMGILPERRDELLPRLIAASRAASTQGVGNNRVRLLHVIGEFARARPFSTEQGNAILAWHELVSRFQRDTSSRGQLGPEWGHAEAVAWLGGAHLARSEAGLALPYLRDALKLRPDFWWVRSIALPQAIAPPR